MTTSENGVESLTPPDAGDCTIITADDGVQECVVVVPLRFSDQDSYGHVNNARTVTLLEEARVRWLNGFAARKISTFLQPKLVASHYIDYLRPVEYRFALHVHMTVRHLGTKSFTLGFVGRQDGEDVVKAATVLVAMDESLESRAIRDDERAYLQGFLREG